MKGSPLFVLFGIVVLMATIPNVNASYYTEVDNWESATSGTWANGCWASWGYIEQGYEQVFLSRYQLRGGAGAETYSINVRINGVSVMTDSNSINQPEATISYNYNSGDYSSLASAGDNLSISVCATGYHVPTASSCDNANGVFNSSVCYAGSLYGGTQLRHQLNNSNGQWLGFQGIIINSTNSETGAYLTGINATIYKEGVYYSQNTTTGNNLQLYLSESANYTVYINKTNYNITPNFYEFEFINESVYNYTFINATPVPSVTLNFFDEETNTLLSGTQVYAQIIGSSNSYNFSSSTGSYFQELGGAGDYNIIFWANDYLRKFYSFSVESVESANISLYLTNASTNYDNVTATITDQNLYELEGAILEIKKFNSNLNQYLISERITADFEGKSRFKAILYDEYYRFNIYYQDELVFSSIPTTIKSNTITFIVNVGEGIGTDYFDLLNLDYSLTYDNSSNRFVFTYSNSLGSISSVKLYTYRITSRKDLEVNTTISTSASGTIYHPISNITGYNYRSCAYGYVNNKYQLITCEENSFKQTAPEKSRELMLFFLILATMLFAFTGIYSISMALILTPIPFVIFELIGWTTIGLPYAISLLLLFVIIALVINKT